MTEWSLPGYTPLRELVRDGSGPLVLARHDATGDPVAIRYLPPGDGAAARSAALLAGLDEPHVAVARDCVESERGTALVRDPVDGVTLRALLVEEGAIGPEAALAVLTDVLRGLAAVHARGVAHGDCRPGTVLVTVAGDGVLVDVGTARQDQRELLAAGTPFYLAPEQWGGATPGPQADIYAATATFFECVAGAPPYFGTDPARLRARHETAPPPVEALPEPLRELGALGLAKDPQQRPATAADFLARVEASAARGLGQQWASRGRAELSRLAAAPQQPFPVDAATAAEAAAQPAAAPPRRLGYAGWTVSAAVVVAAFVGGVVGVVPTSEAPADERGSASPYIRILPPRADASGTPAPTDARPAQPGREAAGPQAAPLAVETTEQRVPPPAGPSTGPSTGVAPRGDGAGTGRPTPRAAPPPAAQSRITGLSIASFTRRDTATRLVVDVETSGTGPVRLMLGYGSGRQGEVGSISLDTVPRELSGRTSYALVHERALGEECRDYRLVIVYADTAAGTPRDSAELTGDPCGQPG